MSAILFSLATLIGVAIFAAWWLSAATEHTSLNRRQRENVIIYGTLVCIGLVAWVVIESA